MRPEHPDVKDIPALRQLWQEAFGDPESYLDLFFSTAFFVDHCLCIRDGGTIAAAAYWLDCQMENQPVAYLYAVATAKAARGRGMCRALMKGIHALLQAQGYGCAILVPGDDPLRQMYRTMGYADFGGIQECICPAGDFPAELQSINAKEFAVLRRKLLPDGGVMQEGAQLDLLAGIAEFYRGDGFLLTRRKEDGFVLELLGQMPTALGENSVHMRTVGEKPFGMFYPLNGNCVPSYFVFAFD